MFIYITATKVHQQSRNLVEVGKDKSFSFYNNKSNVVES